MLVLMKKKKLILATAGILILTVAGVILLCQPFSVITGAQGEKQWGKLLKPSLEPVLPYDGQRGVPLFTELHWISDHKIRDFVMVSKMKGRWRIEGGNKVVFTPERVFPPSANIEAAAKVNSSPGIWSEPVRLKFTTADWVGRIWVEVDLHGVNTVTVYKGSFPVRTMLASGGKVGEETPLGLFYVQDRGENFWSGQYREGARYWVRITGEYLFHSVPFNHQWQFKEQEQARLGEDASHGCIRLSVRDARWFYENIPWGTIVIIHK